MAAPAGPSPAPEKRDQHGHLFAVPAVVLPQGVHEIALLELDGNEDVGGGRQCENEMGDGHGRGGPEREEPAHVQRVPDELVRTRGAETQRGGRPPEELQPDLAQAEKIEMVDEESRYQYEPPAKPEQRVQHRAPGGVRDVPDHATERLPP